ncbi:hypothetical protein BDQ12DRAFT_696498 [Crucibulum laeve]|uniref:N-acetyltransferase domain-containing protein n=1 Tax=Crucibulum laeve TaxID=68775 RepID=A0A5C3M9M3_9AGAR|nr:hypothetical protein BDQ12DRAFT_696498 [Crucibulum laeve]
MLNPQIHPLEINPLTGEPFLRLRNRPNIIITPPRWSDTPHILPILNDERVHVWLRGPPVPFLFEHAETMLQKGIPPCEAVLFELHEARDEKELKTVGASPVRFIRELKADGTDELLGDLRIGRSPNGELISVETVDWEGKQAKEEANNALGVGDPDIVWCIADFLSPAHHRKGIMTDAIHTLLHAWAIPRMNVHRIITSALVGNQGSLKVFEKNGFVRTKTLEDHCEVKGKMRSFWVLEWNADT